MLTILQRVRNLVEQIAYMHHYIETDFTTKGQITLLWVKVDPYRLKFNPRESKAMRTDRSLIFRGICF
jgi:hypothetical protein